MEDNGGRSSGVAIDDTADSAAPPAARRRVGFWVNWALALLTVPGAVVVLLLALGAVMSTAACSDQTCPNLGPSGSVWALLFYGAPVVALLAISVSFFSANRRWGLLVPLTGWALLAADIAVLTITFQL